MTLLPLGADTDLAAKTMRVNAGAEVRRAHAIPNDAVDVFTGGKPTQVKKTLLLVEAVSRIEDQNVHLLVAGDTAPEDREYLQESKKRGEGSKRACRRNGDRGRASSSLDHCQAKDVLAGGAAHSPT